MEKKPFNIPKLSVEDVDLSSGSSEDGVLPFVPASPKSNSRSVSSVENEFSLGLQRGQHSDMNLEDLYGRTFTFVPTAPISPSVSPRRFSPPQSPGGSLRKNPQSNVEDRRDLKYTKTAKKNTSMLMFGRFKERSKTKKDLISELAESDEHLKGFNPTALAQIVTQMKKDITVADHRFLMRTYKKCFLGARAVDWLVDQKYAATRAGAVVIGQVMLEQDYIKHVTDRLPFKDGSHFYRFQSDEIARTPRFSDTEKETVREEVRSILANHDMEELAASMRKAVGVQDIRIGQETHRRCCFASDCYNWIADREIASGTLAATVLCDELVEEGMLFEVHRQEKKARNLIRFKIDQEAMQSNKITPRTDHRLSDLQCTHIVLQMKSEQHGITTAVHNHNGNHTHCFTAQDCIQWLLESKIVATKEDAVDVGKQLVRRQSIHPMSANPFEDPLGCITFDEVEGDILTTRYNLEYVKSMLKDADMGLAVCDRSYGSETYALAFSGQDLVDWAVRKKLSEGRAAGIAMGCELVKQGFFTALLGSQTFEDGKRLYRLADDDDLIRNATPRVQICIEILSREVVYRQFLRSSVQGFIKDHASVIRHPATQMLFTFYPILYSLHSQISKKMNDELRGSGQPNNASFGQPLQHNLDVFNVYMLFVRNSACALNGLNRELCTNKHLRRFRGEKEQETIRSLVTVPLDRILALYVDYRNLQSATISEHKDAAVLVDIIKRLKLLASYYVQKRGSGTGASFKEQLREVYPNTRRFAAFERSFTLENLQPNERYQTSEEQIDIFAVARDMLDPLHGVVSSRTQKKLDRSDAKQTFTGREAATWLAVHVVSDREKAVLLGSKLLKAGHFQREDKGSQGFTDDESVFYTKTSRVLNSGPVESSFEVKSSNSTVLDLVADALKKMLYIFKDFRGLIAKFGEDGLRLIRAHPLFCEVSYEVFNLTKMPRIWVRSMPEVERKVLFINLHNLLVLHSIIVAPSIPVTEHARYRFHRSHKYRLGDVELSCLHIEHLILRAPLSKVPEVHAPHVKAPAHIGDFALTEGDPLINFALYDASDSAATLICYSVESVQEQLERCATQYLSKHVHLECEDNVAVLPYLFEWYKDDFSPALKFIEPFMQHGAHKTSLALVNCASQPRIIFKERSWLFGGPKVDTSVSSGAWTQ